MKWIKWNDKIKMVSFQFKREPDWSTSDNGSDDPRDSRDLARKQLEPRPGEAGAAAADSLATDFNIRLKKERDLKLDYSSNSSQHQHQQQHPLAQRPVDGSRKAAAPVISSSSTSSSLLDAARAAGLDIPGPPASSDPMSSISALLAAAQATGGLPASCAPDPPEVKVKPKPAPVPVSSAGPSQGLDLSNPQTAMANVNVSRYWIL